MTRKYKIISLDVWGNAKDGWEVNDKFNTGIVVELDDECTTNDIKRALYERNYASKKIFPMKIDFTLDDASPVRIYVSLEAQRFSGKPFCELWEIEENE